MRLQNVAVEAAEHASAFVEFELQGFGQPVPLAAWEPGDNALRVDDPVGFLEPRVVGKSRGTFRSSASRGSGFTVREQSPDKLDEFFGGRGDLGCPCC